MGSGTTVCKAIVDSAMLTQADVDCSPPTYYTRCSPQWGEQCSPNQEDVYGKPWFYATRHQAY